MRGHGHGLDDDGLGDRHRQCGLLRLADERLGARDGRLDAAVRLFWRNPETGEEVLNGEVSTGDGLRIHTHPGHTFTAYRGDELVRSFTVSAPRGGEEAFEL